mmetsp:Transcript_1557/g.3856  ORF Transcript_1557/g.3856 Transcript_1557/m.3856 type:complete len:81 (+) Transcript_1557:862-1104(+)
MVGRLCTRKSSTLFVVPGSLVGLEKPNNQFPVLCLGIEYELNHNLYKSTLGCLTEFLPGVLYVCFTENYDALRQTSCLDF